MRHNSERVPGKNYRDLAGKPLYAWIIEALLAVPAVSGILVDTDSPPVIDGLRSNYPAVTVLERPQHLRDGLIPMNDILLHDTTQAEADYYLQTHSTNPLLKPQTIAVAIDAFLAQRAAYDSLFSVTALHTRLYNADGAAINHDPAELLRTQDLPPVYEENSCLYLFDRPTLVARNHRLGERPLMFPIDPAEAWDIDEELDFQVAEFLMKKRINK
jgi:CMP-N-acetylneuraminic acid synthetase